MCGVLTWFAIMQYSSVLPDWLRARLDCSLCSTDSWCFPLVCRPFIKDAQVWRVNRSVAAVSTDIVWLGQGEGNQFSATSQPHLTASQGLWGLNLSKAVADTSYCADWIIKRHTVRKMGGLRAAYRIFNLVFLSFHNCKLLCWLKLYILTWLIIEFHNYNMQLNSIVYFIAINHWKLQLNLLPLGVV